MLWSSNLIDFSVYSNCSFGLLSIDNVDCNKATLEKTSHGMGVAVSVTPKNTELQKKQLVDDIVKSKGISITNFSDK